MVPRKVRKKAEPLPPFTKEKLWGVLKELESKKVPLSVRYWRTLLVRLWEQGHVTNGAAVLLSLYLAGFNRDQGRRITTRSLVAEKQILYNTARLVKERRVRPVHWRKSKGDLSPRSKKQRSLLEPSILNITN